MKRMIKIFFSVAAVLSIAVFSAIFYFDKSVSDNYCVKCGQPPNIATGSLIKYSEISNNDAEVINSVGNLKTYNLKLSLFGLIPVKNITVTETDESQVMVLGQPFGIKIYTEGVMVVGFCDVDTHDGSYNPAANAGVKAGDMILKINDTKIAENIDIQSAVMTSNGQPLKLLIKRNDKTFTLSVTPQKSALEDKWKIGIWVRDSSAGIGTLTFFDPTYKIFAGLGHGICDADTDKILPLESGEFVNAEIVGIKKSNNEVTGELQGIFSSGEIAKFVCNDITGVYGISSEQLQNGVLMPVALKQEIKTGKATILTTLDNDGPCEYECQIEKIYTGDDSKIKNMIIKVTDKTLIEKTGGIVQGMSGSPVIQNGKLIGAVTHVLVDDSTKGYAIFAENMLETAGSVISK